MEVPVLVAVVGGVLTIINTIVGFMLTSLSKSQALIQTALSQNQSDIRVHGVEIRHLAESLALHTDNDRQTFEQIREQQREHHQENQEKLRQIQATLLQDHERKHD